MIYFFTGENNFESTRALNEKKRVFSGEPEQFDGADMTLEMLADVTSGATLFAEKRLVIIKDLSKNTELWNAVPEFLARVSGDTELIFVESKPDKRTKTYKELKQYAELSDFPLHGARDSAKLVDWIMQEGTRQNVKISALEARHLLGRVGYDQWNLYHAVEKLALTDTVSVAVIDDVIEASTSENVFELFETALRGDSERLHEFIISLQRSEDPYRVFGLLSSQIMQFSALALAHKDARAVASDIGAHPYGLSKLTSFAARYTKTDVRRLISIAAETDDALKTLGGDPWIVIQQMLQKIAML